MLLLLILTISSVNTRYQYGPNQILDERNFFKKLKKTLKRTTKHIGKSISKAGKAIERETRKVTKPIEKTVRKVTKPIEKTSRVVTRPIQSAIKEVSRFVYSSSSSAYKNPVKITLFQQHSASERFEGEVDTVAANIAKAYSFEGSSVANFLRSSEAVTKLGGNAKRLFSCFEMGIKTDRRHRTAKLITARLTVLKSPSGICVDVSYVDCVADVFADMTKKKSRTQFGVQTKRKSSLWRPLSTEELNGIYSQTFNHISSSIASLRK